MGSVFDDPPNLKSWYPYSIIIFQPKMPHHIHVTRLGAWWWCIWSLWGIQNRVISTPNGWSLTRLPNLSRTHVLITAEVENDIKLYSWLCRSLCKNSFQERALPYLQGCHEGFSRLASSTELRWEPGNFFSHAETLGSNQILLHSACRSISQACH